MKTAQQTQFEQVKDKFASTIKEMQNTLDLMPVKGNTSETCQRTAISIALLNLEYTINGMQLEDFTPNEYSVDFKLSYS